MHYRLTDTLVIITMEAHEITAMEDCGRAVYGTPNANAPYEPISQAYIGDRPQWRDDRLLANGEDFEDAGYLPSEEDSTEYTVAVRREL